MASLSPNILDDDGTRFEGTTSRQNGWFMSSASFLGRRAAFGWQRRNSSNKHRLPIAQVQRSSAFFSEHVRRRRWWDILFFAILLLGIIQAGALPITSVLLHKKHAPIRIDIQYYPALKYKELEMIAPATISQEAITVYHVTKEFGAATMGGMGMIITALASAQQKTGRMKPAIVMPLYSFLRENHTLKKEVDLTTLVSDKNGHSRPVDFRVWKMMYVASPPEEIVADGINTTVPAVQPSEPVPVYLIGPGKKKPFDKAFLATRIVDIYSSPDGLPQEWSNQYFNKAAAEFLLHQASATDQSPLFDPAIQSTSHRVDVIHLHGATNAYTAKYIRDSQKRHQLGSHPPALLYTMHDYLDELQYSILNKNVKKFLDAPDPQLERYSRGHRMFMSSLGIDYSDVVTFVSHQMAVDIVEGRDDFYLKELVIDSILHKAENGRFFGITNGVDYGALDPFSSPVLVNHNAVYPRYALEQVNQHLEQSITGEPTTWSLSAATDDYVVSAKDRARRFLASQGVLSQDDMDRPLVLFVGRFQYNKGLEMFDDAARYFMERDMKFLVIGQPNNYPLKWVEALEKRYPDHVIVMSTASQQQQWLLLCRAAADFVFVPSLTESFGLVAAEGLLFGSPVISTGAGGLKEFLEDRPKTAARHPPRVLPNGDAAAVTNVETYNGYLFEPFDSVALEAAIEDAYQDYKLIRNSRALREELALRMIRDAFSLGWDRGRQRGPVHEYLKAYQIAMIDRKIPFLSKHEVDEEQSLLDRLHTGM